MRNHSFAKYLSAALFLLLATPSFAAKCGGDFNGFLAQMVRDAQAQGVRPDVAQNAFSGLAIDQNVLAFDRRQRGTFRKTFEEYVATEWRLPHQARAVTAGASRRAARARREAVRRTEGTDRRDLGPGERLRHRRHGQAAGGATIATMAHDCRRTELFQGELIAALKILQRGDLNQQTMIGAYAGELGQTQFLPSSYIKYGVDYDGNGHIDLRRSVPDVLASTANLLKVNGWQPGAPFGEGTQNFQVMREWNRSEVYRKTMHYFAQQLGAR